MNKSILYSTDLEEVRALTQALPGLRSCADLSRLACYDDMDGCTIFLGVGQLMGDLRQLRSKIHHLAPLSRIIALLDPRDGVSLEEIAAAGFDAMLPLPIHESLAQFLAQGGNSGGLQTKAETILQHDLNGAWDRGELRVHYQPRCDSETGKVRGFEALVRWQHPTRGLLSPVEFIPIAEQSGMIIQIGTWVLHEACAQMKAWDVLGAPEVRIAVNLSPIQFTGDGPLDAVKEALQASGLDASRLELEVTESLMVEDPEGVIQDLHKLKSLGVAIAIDDFGTGYSSLSYLRRFPVDTLKIDKCFVDDLAVDPGDAAIVTSIVILGQSLGLSIVAEGVETERQLEFLRVLGVDEIQGYLLSRPLPPEKVPAYLCANLAGSSRNPSRSGQPESRAPLRAEPTG